MWADRGLLLDDPVRAFAYLKLGEAYMAANKPYDAEGPLMIAMEIADSGSMRKGDFQQLCREAAAESRCLLAANYARTGNPAAAESLFSSALELMEVAKKQLDLPQTDSLLDQYVRLIESSDHADQTGVLSARINEVRLKRDKEYAGKRHD